MNQTDPTTNDPEISRIRSLLPELSIHLEAGLKDIEPGFETLGKTLQTVYAETEKITKGIMASVDDMAGDANDTLLNHISHIVNDALSVLSSCRASIANHLDDIETASEHLSSLCAVCSQMKKKASFLNIIGMNLSIEGSRTNDATAMFNDFGEEIKSLAGKMGAISSDIHQNATQIKTDQSTVQRDIVSNLQAFDALSASTKDAVRSATEEIRRIGLLASKTLETAATHSREITKTVGEIVMAIQFHDIARQQVEHIVSALEDVRPILETLPVAEAQNESLEKNGNEEKGQIYSIVSLQAAQLRQVVDEAQATYEKIEDAFEKIGDEVERLINKVTVSNSDQLEGSELEKGFKTFQKNIQTLRSLLAQGHGLESRIDETMARSSSAVSTLFQFTEDVGNINVELQYKALNAMIMTNKLGNRGSTLEVLSKNVRDHSSDSNENVDKVLAIIDAITSLSEKKASLHDDTINLHEPSTASDQENDVDYSSINQHGQTPAIPAHEKDVSISTAKKTDDPDRLNHALDTQIALVDDAFSRYQDHCLEAEKISGEIFKTVGEINEGLVFFPQWIQNCRQQLDAMESLLSLLSPWKVLADTLPEDAKEKLTQRYTMESERRVHNAMTGFESAPEEEDPLFDTQIDETDEDGDDGAWDDNIELF